MCGLFYSKNLTVDLDLLSSIKRRGPENFSTCHYKDEFFAHSLLNTIGLAVEQPIKSTSGTLLYNGSTYNYTDSKFTNDTQWLADNLDHLLSNTIDVIKSLRGEYALCYVTDAHVVFAADQFFVRNLWYYYNKSDKTLAVCSHPKVLIDSFGAAWPCEENKIYTLDKSNFELSMVTNTHWNFDQVKNNLDDVFEEFEKSVLLRWEPKSITTFSSGLDSGAITCCLENHNIDFLSIADVSEEYNQTVEDRIARHNSIRVTESYISNQHLNELFDLYEHPRTKSPGNNTAKHQTFCDIADSMQCKILIYGEGADELYCDYGHNGKKTRTRSKFGGMFHENLEIMWPWHNHYSGLFSINSRLDIHMGFNGKEIRMPFQDQHLVQKWLNTTVELKNKSYKHWIVEYLKQYDYPYHLDKIGMSGKSFY